jgi:hypothetical protein
MLVHEDRLVNATPCGAIGVGEQVTVTTRMGAHVSVGEVIGSTPFGLSIREGDDDHRIEKFYASDFYLFSVSEPEQPVVATKVLDDTSEMSPDERVEYKLRMSEGGEPDPKGGGRQAVEPDDEEGGTGQDEKQPKRSVAEPESVVDVSKLPKDIQKAIISTDELDTDQLNMVLGQISDAAMKSLKRANIKETELYGIVDEIQAVVYKVLTGKAPSKKK